MYTLDIRFPFSSVNDENFVLLLSASRDGAFTNAVLAMEADPNFKLISDEVGDDGPVITFEGTLQGDVVSKDDEREDVFTPMVASKLSFNMVCSTFPSWLMDICNYYTDMRVLLYAIDPDNDTALERWRGYLQCNTLDMVVVNDLMACPLVAIDEISIAKYIRLRDTITGTPATPTLLEIFEKWHAIHFANFTHAYEVASITGEEYLLFSRNLAYNDSGGEVLDLLGTLYINLQRYYLMGKNTGEEGVDEPEKDATWSDLFTDILQYLGVHWSIGSSTDDVTKQHCHHYIVGSIDYGVYATLLYVLGGVDPPNEIPYSDAFGEFGNQQKIGADLRISYEPDKYKGVRINSEPERMPVHKYLEDATEIEPNTGHGNGVVTRVGQEGDNNQHINNYKWRKLQYIRPNVKDDDYVDFEDCTVSDSGRAVGQSGYFPCTDSALALVKPDGNCTDSLDFITTKNGMITVRMGEYEEDNAEKVTFMKDYFMILNNKWGRKFWDSDNTVNDPVSATPSLIGTFYPFGTDGSLIPYTRAWLKIDFDAYFLNENIGSLEFTYQDTLYNNLYGSRQLIMPMLTTYHDYSDPSEPTNGVLEQTGNNYVRSFYPYITCRLAIGNFWWDTDHWTYDENEANAPFFNMPLVPDDVESYWLVSHSGEHHRNILNYYYTACHPFFSANSGKFLLPLDALSIHGQPLQGRVRLEIYGRLDSLNARNWQGLGTPHYNNILFIVLDNIEISVTDEAELGNQDIRLKAESITDPNSDTKEMMEVNFGLATPQVQGMFTNTLLFDNGKEWAYLQRVYMQGGLDGFVPEKRIAGEMADVYSRPKAVVEFSRPMDAIDTDNIYNVDFRVRQLTEINGVFMPIQRTFSWTKSRVRWKLQRIEMGKV